MVYYVKVSATAAALVLQAVPQAYGYDSSLTTHSSLAMENKFEQHQRRVAAEKKMREGMPEMIESPTTDPTWNLVQSKDDSKREKKRMKIMESGCGESGFFQGQSKDSKLENEKKKQCAQSEIVQKAQVNNPVETEIKRFNNIIKYLKEALQEKSQKHPYAQKIAKAWTIEKIKEKMKDYETRLTQLQWEEECTKEFRPE